MYCPLYNVMRDNLVHFCTIKYIVFNVHNILYGLEEAYAEINNDLLVLSMILLNQL